MNRDAAELRKQRSANFHKAFFTLDTILFIVFVGTSLFELHWGEVCSISFFAYYSIFYLGQSIQHCLCFTMPKIDIVSQEKRLFKYLVIVSIIEISYFLVAFLFWTKSDLNPIYCFMIQVLRLHFLVGSIFILHFIASLLLYVQVLHGFITRKYYLLALGGFQVEQRLIRERQQALRQMALIQPFYNEYPVDRSSSDSSRKSYRFDDIAQEVKSQLVCSICLTHDKEGMHPIYTPCKHFFHRQCIQDWAKINNKCPQCRTHFTQIETPLPQIKQEVQQD